MMFLTLRSTRTHHRCAIQGSGPRKHSEKGTDRISLDEINAEIKSVHEKRA